MYNTYNKCKQFVNLYILLLVKDPINYLLL